MAIELKGDGSNRWLGGFYWNPQTNSLGFETDQRMTQDQYNNFLNYYTNYKTTAGHDLPYNQWGPVLSQLGLTEPQFGAALHQMQLDEYSSNPNSYLNSMMGWNDTYKNTPAMGYGGLFDTTGPKAGLDTVNTIYGGAYAQPTQQQPANQVAMPSQPAATAQLRTTNTRAGSTASPVAMTRGQAPPLAVDPGISSLVGSAAATGTSTPTVGGRRMTSTAAPTGTGAVLGTNPVANVAANPAIATAQNNTQIPTMGTNPASTYNPVPYSNPVGTNGFINSSGGFAYDMLPGMYNYLMQYLGQNANTSSGVNQALTNYLGQNLTGDYPQQMSEYLQQLIGTLGSGQLQTGTNLQNATTNQLSNLAGGQGTSTPIQQQVQNTLSQLIGGSGLSPEYVAAAQESILKPALENTYGAANNMAGGVGELSSGLAQELARRTQSDFTNQLIQQGYNNLSNFLNQGNTAGATSYNQGLNLANLTGNQGQNAINNTLNSMSQGQNLMGTLLSSLLGLQGNAQNYTTALTGQYGNLAQGLLSNKTVGEASANANASNKASTIGNLLGNLVGGLTGGSSGSGGPVASGNLNNAFNAIKKLLGFGDNTAPEGYPQNPEQPTGGSINDIVSGIPYQDIELYNMLNDIMGGSGEYIGGNVTDLDWSNLLGQSGFSGTDSPVDWGDLFSNADSTWGNSMTDAGLSGYDIPIDITQLFPQQPSTYQWYDNLYGDDLSWLYGYNY